MSSSIIHQKIRILFLCTHNACRSQMAEGWAKALRAEDIETYSAGTDPGTVDPRAARVMKEAGVDISGHRSKGVKELAGIDFDYVVTLCGSARETCPLFPGAAKVVHRGFDDPPQLGRHAATEEERLNHYRRVRDEIKQLVLGLPDNLREDETGEVRFILNSEVKS